ncbi:MULTISPECIES: flavin reductase family protein [unclassified Microbacterium]|uniref:flavin reductase family protein n=1 Tax=unclassified Microbacterium TaxID=2609290 RepID=UPI000C3F405F|nr:MULTISPECIES: flavin reductase family protein [unclassified Microbacterium]MBU19959.1 flavin reductase [Microbacterium sp.]
MYVDASTLSPAETYRLLVGSVVPRPIAWVTSGLDVINLAPFSSFAWVSQHPAMLGFTVNRRADRRKDTVVNIEEVGEYVVNIASADMLAALHASSEFLDPAESEAERVGMALAPSRVVRVPRLRDVPVAMECRFHSTTAFSPTGGEFVVGTVVAWHIADDVLTGGRIDTEKVNPLGRLAGPRYTTLGDITELPPVPGG